MQENEESEVVVGAEQWPDETPYECMVALISDVIVMAREIGHVTDDEVRAALELLLDREAERERAQIRVK